MLPNHPGRGIPSIRDGTNLFGLYPNYGCCTANLHQGWPKFAAHLWMRTPEGGIAALAYAPSTASCSVKDTPVRVELDTDYPFRETLKLRVCGQPRPGTTDC